MKKETDNLIVKLSIEFSLDIIAYSEKLEEVRKYVISKQLLRSGTSIGANVHEAQHAESKADFIHKLKIATKEAEETDYWLLLCELSANYPQPTNLREKLKSLIKILSKIIITSKSSS